MGRAGRHAPILRASLPGRGHQSRDLDVTSGRAGPSGSRLDQVAQLGPGGHSQLRERVVEVCARPCGARGTGSARSPCCSARRRRAGRSRAPGRSGRPSAILLVDLQAYAGGAELALGRRRPRGGAQPGVDLARRCRGGAAQSTARCWRRSHTPYSSWAWAHSRGQVPAPTSLTARSKSAPAGASSASVGLGPRQHAGHPLPGQVVDQSLLGGADDRHDDLVEPCPPGPAADTRSARERTDTCGCSGSPSASKRRRS